MVIPEGFVTLCGGDTSEDLPAPTVDGPRPPSPPLEGGVSPWLYAITPEPLHVQQWILSEAAALKAPFVSVHVA